MAELLLGPILRFVSQTEATIWVQTDGPCSVSVLGRSAETFRVGDRHYALVVLRELEPGSATEYAVALDGVPRWPLPDAPFGPSVLRTLPSGGPIDVVWGSCRVARPQVAPYVLDAEQDPEGTGVDALYALAVRMREQPPARWPAMLLLLGDQVYADEVSPRTLAAIRRRRSTDRPPGEEVLDVDEYTMLYDESWGDPALRWLLSTVPSAMMFDDHDVHDDWNTSESWVAEMRATDWWQERILAGLSTYWVYQHLGNLSPAELDADPLVAEVHAADDAGPVLRRFAEEADREPGGGLWAFARDIGSARLVMLDGREGRVLQDGRREMMDEDEWAWAERHVSGDHDHVLIGGTLPVLLAPTLHWLEAWNEAVCDGAWGGWLRGAGEFVRRAADLEHWAAFQSSFNRLIALVTSIASGERSGEHRAPASVVMLGGDVHQAYLEQVGFPAGAGARSAVYQAVCSPFRNQLGRRERRLLRVVRRSDAIRRLARALARSAGVTDPRVGWRLVQEPTWRNQLGWLHLDGRSLEVEIETTPADHRAVLETSLRHRIA